jgi:hypothetical protein
MSMNISITVFTLEILHTAFYEAAAVYGLHILDINLH